MITSHVGGSTKKTEEYLNFLKTDKMFAMLDRYGRMGVDALSRATPRDTGETAQMWGYQVAHNKNGKTSITWFNTNREGGVNVAILIQYGHGTGTGGYVLGVDYVNPAIRPIFEQILNDVWRQVTNG